MSHNTENQSEPETQEKLAGVAFFIGVMAGLFVFALLVDDQITTPWGEWIGQGLSMLGKYLIISLRLSTFFH